MFLLIFPVQKSHIDISSYFKQQLCGNSLRYIYWDIYEQIGSETEKSLVITVHLLLSAVLY